MICWPTTALCSGLSYADNQVFPHGYIDFDQPGPLVLADYPFASIHRAFAFQASYRSLYDMRELTDSRVALACSRRVFTAGLAAATFGKPDYFHQMGLTAFASWHLHVFAGGVSLIYNRLSFNKSYDAIDMTTMNMGAVYLRGQIKFFAVMRAFNQPRGYDDGRPVMPELELGLSHYSVDGLGSQGKVLFVRHQKPTAELSQGFWLSNVARIDWALVLLPVRIGGGIHLEKGHMAFEYRISHHPVLGLTHAITMSVFSGKSAVGAGT